MGGGARPEDFGIGRLFRQISDAVIVADARTERILLWNDGASSMFGYETEEALSMPLHTLVAPELVDAHRAGLARYERAGSGHLVDSGKPVEVEAVKKDGTRFFVELTLSSIAEANGGGRVVLALIRDATDRKAAERWRAAELQQQQALEINDSIVQGLVAAKAFIELGEQERGTEILGKTLDAARSMVSQLMKERESRYGLSPGDFVRSTPASLDPLGSDEE